ncbi:MAG: helix-turn-helix domain-containing protein [Butyricicoccus sp.]
MQKKKQINVAIGLRIQKTREHRRYTQEQLSELIGISTQHLSNIERGVAGISLSGLKRTCEVLNISADYLLLGVDNTQQGSGIINQLQTLPTEQAELVENGLSQLLQALSLANDSPNKTETKNL